MKSSRHVRFAAVAMAVAALSANVQAVDGVKLIDQAKALAGGVTPGDAPGFPVTIGVSGSYQLSSDLSVPADTDAIVITTGNVTLNLNGFSINGSGGVSGFGVRTLAPGPAAVVNGMVRGMGASGVQLGSGRVEKVIARENGNHGIVVSNAGIISSSSAIGNVGIGITSGSGNVITGNTARSNGAGGIGSADGLVTGNVVTFNGGVGIAAFGGTVIGNTVHGNDGTGLALSGSTGYAQNVVNSNGDSIVGGVSMGQNVCDGALC